MRWPLPFISFSEYVSSEPGRVPSQPAATILILGSAARMDPATRLCSSTNASADMYSHISLPTPHQRTP